MHIAFGTDEATALTDAVKQHLADGGHNVVAAAAEGAPWPDVGRAVGEAVVDGSAEIGVVCCWTGTGVSIAANKVPGVRAALCTEVATEMLDAFLATEPDPGESAEIAKLS